MGERIKAWEARLIAIREQRATAEQRQEEGDPERLADEALALIDQLERLDGADEIERRRFFRRAVERVVIRHATRRTGSRQRHIPIGATVAVRGPLGSMTGPGPKHLEDGTRPSSGSASPSSASRRDGMGRK